MTVKELILHLSDMPEDMEIAHMIWQPDDAHDKAEDMGVTLTEEEATKVIGIMQHDSNCEYGMTWDHVQYAIEEVKGL